MPHLSIRVDDSIDVAVVAKTQSDAIDIVAGQFGVPADYVASGVAAQEKHRRNRKTIEVTIAAAGDAEGRRKSRGDAVADQLHRFYSDWLRQRRAGGSVSVCVQIIETSPYREGAF